MTMRRLLLALLPALSAAVTGQGPRGIHPIDDRYVAVADSSIDAVVIVDSRSGGAVVGHLVLHDRSDDDNQDAWLGPVSLASCDTCDHIFLTSNQDLYAIELEMPLAEMAEKRDFSSLENAEVNEYWPDNWNEKYKGDGYLRMISIAHDGSSAYVAHAKGGIFSFDPLNPAESSRRARHVIHIGDAEIGDDINGLHHTRSLKNLVITRRKYVHILKILDDEGYNPLDYGEPISYKLTLDYHCSQLYDGAPMKFVDTAIINEYAFVLGQPAHSDQAEHNGVALYRLTWYDEDKAWKDCEQIAGSGLESAGWADGSGQESKFSSTPREIAVVPNFDSHMIIVGDVDNRALRYVDVTVPVESHDQTDKVRVSSVAYNADLYDVLYRDEDPWTSLTVEGVMEQDGKSYYHSGPDGLYSMNFDAAQDECGRVGIGRVCTLPEIRARFARGQYPTLDGDDRTWTTVWTNEPCTSCHLEDPGKCRIQEDGDASWGENFKMIAVFNPITGLTNQCIHADRPVDTMSMCCGLGGPAVLNPSAASEGYEEDSATMDSKKAGAISAGVVVPLFLIAAVAYGLYMKDKTKPSWWPKFLRKGQSEETGHAPHREVDLRGRDFI